MNILNLFMKVLNYCDIELVKEAPYNLSKPMPVFFNATKLIRQTLPYPTNSLLYLVVRVLTSAEAF